MGGPLRGVWSVPGGVPPDGLVNLLASAAGVVLDLQLTFLMEDGMDCSLDARLQANAEVDAAGCLRGAFSCEQEDALCQQSAEDLPDAYGPYPGLLVQGD